MKTQSPKPVLAASIALGVSLLVGLSLSGCAKPESKQDKVSAGGANLVAMDDGGDVAMPHTVDSATEFPAALESVATGSKKPQLRTTDANNTVVRVEKAAPTSKPGLGVTPKGLERDWDGTVLIPSGTQMSHAHTDNVSFSRIEAHPLTDGSLRVWVRVNNLTDRDLDTRVACNFHSSSSGSGKTSFVPTIIPANEAIDVYFMSPMPNVVSYTILAR